MNQKFKELAFVEVDTHKNEHTTFVIDCFGHPIALFTIENRPKHIEKSIKEINKTAQSYNLKPVFGLEDVTALGHHLAKSLIIVGYHLKAINPIETARKHLPKARSDRSDTDDALAISKVLISKFDNLPTVK
jgi:hypothetical protein